MTGQVTKSSIRLARLEGPEKEIGHLIDRCGGLVDSLRDHLRVEKRIMPVQVQSAANGRSGASNSPDATPCAITWPMMPVMHSIWATQTSQSSSIAISTISCSLESPT